MRHKTSTLPGKTDSGKAGWVPERTNYDKECEKVPSTVPTHHRSPTNKSSKYIPSLIFSPVPQLPLVQPLPSLETSP